MEKVSRPFWRRALLALFSVGWLLPMWWVGDAVVALHEFDAAPELFTRPPDLFFFIHAGREVFAAAMLWLTAVLGFWILAPGRR